MSTAGAYVRCPSRISGARYHSVTTSCVYARVFKFYRLLFQVEEEVRKGKEGSCRALPFSIALA
jgi:hypothetical protein